MKSPTRKPLSTRMRKPRRAGRGAIGKDGKMIDYANIRMAKALLKKFEIQSSNNEIVAR